MPELATLGIFAAASLVMLLTPGPAVAYIVATSVAHGRLAAIASALGLVTGGLLHLLAALAGLTAIVSASPAAFAALKYAGALYLVWLGVRLLWTDAAAAGEPGSSRSSHRRLFFNGVAVNLGNPKAAIFFLAFLPQFVDPARGAAWSQGLILGGLFLTLALLTDSAYALGAGAVAERFRSDGRFSRVGRTVSGVTYIALGIAAAMVRYPS